MTISEAIEILEDLTTTLPQRSPEERRKAVRLGIEALERVEFLRQWNAYYVGGLLPRETE